MQGGVALTLEVSTYSTSRQQAACDPAERPHVVLSFFGLTNSYLVLQIELSFCCCFSLFPVPQFLPPGEIVEGMTLPPEDNPFARLFGKQSSTADILSQPVDIDLNDSRSYDRQIYDQVRCCWRSSTSLGAAVCTHVALCACAPSCSVSHRPNNQ